MASTVRRIAGEEERATDGSLLRRTPRSAPQEAVLQRNLRRAVIPGLDAVRAFAALLVVLYHFGIATSVMHLGNLGVEIFLTLSGFLITWLLLQEQNRDGAIRLGRFYARRSLRIFPAFYVYGLSSLTLLALSHRQIPWGQFAAAFLYVTDFRIGLGYSEHYLLAHTWSLALEEQFYLLWPLGIVLCRGDKQRLTRLLVACIALIWIHRAWLVIGGRESSVYLYVFPDVRMDQLLIGCLVAVVLERGLLWRWWAFVCRDRFLPVIVALCLALSAHAEAVSNYTYLHLIGFVVDPLLAAILIVQVIAWSTEPSWSWLSWPSVRRLGKISYSVYLYHVIFMTTGVHLLLGRYLRWWPLVLAVKIGSTVLLAGASFVAVEKPFLRLKKRLESGTRTSIVPMVAVELSAQLVE
jgi:peptidoglycan/LPS O-acetylase OafA/YrhL